MDFRLNKIDPEVRQRVNDITSSGKVHSKNSTVIQEDERKNKKHDHDFEAELKKQKDKKAHNAIEVEAVLTGTDSNEEKVFVGTILDIRK